MPNLTIVNTGRAKLDVHAAGCADLTRKPAYRTNGGATWDLTAASRKAVVLDIYDPASFEDMAADGANWRDFTADVRFFPCVRDLPDESTEPNPDDQAPALPAERRTVTITRDQIERWAGRPLTDDEVTRLDNCIPLSSIPEAIGAIVAQFERDPHTDADDHQDQDDADQPDPTACQLCGAPGGFPYCTGRLGRTASCAEMIELDGLSPTGR